MQKSSPGRRDVPLSAEAIRLLRQLGTDEGRAFAISSTQTIDALFRKAKARAMIDGLQKWAPDAMRTAVTDRYPVPEFLRKHTTA
jgi:hypothetical protein